MVPGQAKVTQLDGELPRVIGGALEKNVGRLFGHFNERVHGEGISESFFSARLAFPPLHANTHKHTS